MNGPEHGVVPPSQTTGFERWERSTLERFAREAADENKALRTELKQLKGLVILATEQLQRIPML